MMEDVIEHPHRFRVSSLSVLHPWLRHPNDQSEIKEQQRRGEEQTVQKIERAANSREQISRVFYVSAALDNGFGQISEDCRKPQ